MAAEVAAAAGAHFATAVLAPLEGDAPLAERIRAVGRNLESFYEGGARGCVLDMLSVGEPGADASAGLAAAAEGWIGAAAARRPAPTPDVHRPGAGRGGGHRGLARGRPGHRRPAALQPGDRATRRRPRRPDPRVAPPPHTTNFARTTDCTGRSVQEGCHPWNGSSTSCSTPTRSGTSARRVPRPLRGGPPAAGPGRPRRRRDRVPGAPRQLLPRLGRRQRLALRPAPRRAGGVRPESSTPPTWPGPSAATTAVCDRRPCRPRRPRGDHRDRLPQPAAAQAAGAPASIPSRVRTCSNGWGSRVVSRAWSPSRSPPSTGTAPSTSPPLHGRRGAAAVEPLHRRIQELEAALARGLDPFGVPRAHCES